MATQIRGAQIKATYAGDGLGVSGNIMSVNVDNSSIEISDDTLQIKAAGITDAMISGAISDGNLAEDYIKTSEVDDSTIEFGGGSLNIVSGGVTGTQLASSVAGSGLTGGGGSALAVGAGTAINVDANDIDVKYDNTTVGVTGDQLYVIASGVDHDDLLNFVTKEHLDWTADQGSNNIHDNNILSGSVTQHEGDINHDNLTGFVSNEHVDHSTVTITGAGLLAGQGGYITASRTFTLNNSDIDHDDLTNFVSDEHVAHSTVSISTGGILSGGGTIDASRTITLASSGVDHDATTNFVTKEHLDWTADQGSNNIHDNNIVSSSVTQHQGDIDHGSISGLSGDDHTQYSLVAGTRAFTGTVGGITPTAGSHLTTKDYVDGLIQGLDWQESVLSITTEYGDASASGTNRYIAPTTSGSWTANYIYEWNGTTWSGMALDEGTATWVEDEDVLYTYNGSSWVKFGTTITHNNTSGKQGGTSGEYYHLTVSDYTDWVTNRNEVIQDIVGPMTSGTQTNITVTYQDSTGDIDFVVNTADTSTLGVASFAAADFDVSAGAVSLEDTVVKSISTESGALTPSAHSLTISGGEGVDVTHTGTVITVAGEDATTANKGVASFDSNHFSVTGGAVSIATDGIDDTLIDWGTGAGQVNLDDVPDGSSYERVAANQLLSGIYIDATTTVKGIASFAAADFDVSSGAVSLEDTVLKSISTDSGDLTIAEHAITISGGEGIDVTHAGVDITVAGEDATTTNKGIASFDSGDFSVSTGAVSVKTNGIDEGQLNMYNSPIISGVLGWTDNGLEWVEIDTATGAITEEDVRLDNFSTTISGQTGFTLNYTPVNNSVQIFLNGLLQEKGSGKDYTQSGTSITFSVAPEVGDILIAHYHSTD